MNLNLYCNIMYNFSTAKTPSNDLNRVGKIVNSHFLVNLNCCRSCACPVKYDCY